MRYYDLKRNWTKKILPNLGDRQLSEILVRDFNGFTMGRWAMPFAAEMKPEDVDTGDWRCHRRIPFPRYWTYVCRQGCHWVVNFALRLAEVAESTKPWRIVSSRMHSTVWDGSETLFDFNFQAFGLAPRECWRAATWAQDNKVQTILDDEAGYITKFGGGILEPGVEVRCGLASPHFYENDDEDDFDARKSLENLQSQLRMAQDYLEQFKANAHILQIGADLIDELREGVEQYIVAVRYDIEDYGLDSGSAPGGTYFERRITKLNRGIRQKMEGLHHLPSAGLRNLVDVTP